MSRTRASAVQEIRCIPVNEKGCRIWTKKVKSDEYPDIWFDGKGHRVNRLMLEAKLGRPLLPGMMSLHTCDNPRCVSEDHLYEGTHQDNVDDMVRRGRYVSNWPEGRGETSGYHKLNDDSIREIRRLYAAGGVSQRELGRMFGVSQYPIRMILCGRTWSHVK